MEEKRVENLDCANEILTEYNEREYNRMEHFENDLDVETNKLVERAKEGDINARNLLVEKNYRLITSIAVKYIGRAGELDDLIQEGTIGFMRGIEKYNPEYKIKFSTFITYYITSDILAYIANNTSPIKVPINLRTESNKYVDRVLNLAYELKRMPTSDEITEKLGVSLNQIKKYELINAPVTSLNCLIGDEEEDELISRVPSELSSPEDIVTSDYRSLLLNIIENMNLKEKELLLIKMRYGFINNEVYGYKQIAKVLGCSHQNVTQLEQRILKRIRAVKEIEDLAIFTDNEKESLSYVRKNRKKPKKSER